ncbi:MAG: hypothetical protein R3D82_20285 [Xanthobacteraceae bacterium]
MGGGIFGISLFAGKHSYRETAVPHTDNALHRQGFASLTRPYITNALRPSRGLREVARRGEIDKIVSNPLNSQKPSPQEVSPRKPGLGGSRACFPKKWGHQCLLF